MRNKRNKFEWRWPLIGIAGSLLGLFLIYNREGTFQEAVIRIIYFVGKALYGMTVFSVAVFIVFGLRRFIYNKIINKDKNRDS